MRRLGLLRGWFSVFMSRNLFDISKYNCSSIDEFVSRWKGQQVKCQNHDDKNPSAQVNETNIYCHTCSQAFFFKNDNKYKTQYHNNQTTAEAYYDNLINARNSSAVRQYLQKRGLNENNIITEFHLGFKVDNNTLVFPIKNSNGYINGFGFRQIDDNKTPKYINSSSDDTFHKGNNLYGIDKISDKCNHLIICEGYIDVISDYKHDFKNVVCFVSIMGILH